VCGRPGRSALQPRRLWPVFAQARSLALLRRLGGRVRFSGGASDDVAKCRRQELCGLPRGFPFEGLIYACSGVALAPIFTVFAGAPACWSMTMRL
jgi:hypothetical protein